MVNVITIRTSGDLVKGVAALKRMRTKIPQMTREGMQKWGEMLVGAMKNSARTTGRIKNFTGTLQGKGIRWEQGKRSNTGRLFIRKYGVQLDDFPDQHVAIKRSRPRLLRWALRANSQRIRSGAEMVARGEKYKSGKKKGQLKKYAIFVRKHPFIRAGYKRARPKLGPMLKKMAKRGARVR